MASTIHLGTHKGLFTLKRAGSNWEIDRVDFLGEPVSMLFEDPRNGCLYAGLNLGHFGVKLHRSENAGKDWREVAAPLYPPGAEFAIPSFEEGVPPTSKPASLTEIWALEAAGDDQPDTLWAGTIPGGLFLSRDRGDSWELIESLWNQESRMKWFGGGKDEPGIHSICVDPRDSKHVTVAVSCGGVWGTHDRGDSWSQLGAGLRAEFMPPDLAFDPVSQDPHRLAQCEANPDVMWVQHHNGVFHSTDGAKNFREIEKAGPATFGFAVCAHPTDEKTAWFIPGVKDECRVPVDGKLVVTRTRDGGETFDTLINGLPQQHAYDIVYRHAMDIDVTGEQLAFGSTTGNFFTTDDGGDSWDCFSNYLPPIYCVRVSRR